MGFSKPPMFGVVPLATIIVFVGFVYWAIRGARGTRLRRWSITVALLPPLCGLAVFGNGSAVESTSFPLNPDLLPPQIRQVHFDAALDVAASAEFVDYYRSIRPKTPPIDGDTLRPAMRVVSMRWRELSALGASLQVRQPDGSFGPPRPEAEIFRFVFHRTFNAGWFILGIGERQRRAEANLISDPQMSCVIPLATLQVQRAARSDAERIAVIEILDRFRSPPPCLGPANGQVDRFCRRKQLIYYCRNSLRAAKNSDFGCGLPAALGGIDKIAKL